MPSSTTPQEAGSPSTRRKSWRKYAHFMVKYQTEDPKPSIGTAMAVDVSGSGIAFEGSDQLRVGSRVHMQLSITGLEHTPVRAEGHVVRVAEVVGTALFLHGVAIDTIEPADRQALEEYAGLGNLNQVLRQALQRGASDVHLIASRQPMFRIHGDLVPADEQVLESSALERILTGMMTDEQSEVFMRHQDVDFSYNIPEGTRFRVNVHVEMGRVEAAIRIVSSSIPGWEELGLPRVVRDLAKLHSGMVIVSGPAGSGKSTTLASMVELISGQRRCMIISIEDPIEYVYSSAGSRSVVKQREVGVDTPSFASALRHVLRQDPNVILVGEIRDLDSIAMALTAAETGHLVLTTLHTANTVECINRIVDAYPAAQQSQVRNQLSTCLQGIIGQRLLPRRDLKGRALATEVLIVTPAISHLIRQGQTSQINLYLETGSQSGMHLLEHSLASLVKRRLVEMDVARGYAHDPAKFAAFVARS
jgi:twitching motility protein PilT